MLKNAIVFGTREFSEIPVDPAGECRYLSEIKPCKSEGLARGTGVLLSNTSIICLQVWDNLGKLRLNPDRSGWLECTLTEKQCLMMSWRPIRLLVG